MAIALSPSLPLIPDYGAGRRSQNRTQARPDTRSQPQPQAAPDRNERLVQGEVISSRNDPRRGINSTQRTLSERNATFNAFGESRRFSMQASIATYQQNEALITEPDKPRQVSGIIDEYV